MWIKAFSKHIEAHLHPHTLQNTTVVIDGTNFFYQIYSIGGFPFEFGCECDRYADHLRNYLDMFKKANVRCYFIFKGGVPNVENLERRNLQRRDFSVGDGESKTEIVIPILGKQVCEQVLNELQLDYTICVFSSKPECIAFAQKLNCPVLSYDIEYAFSDVQYIPHNNLTFDSDTSTINCGLFNFDSFLNENSVTREKLATFATLTDLTTFPENFFMTFIKTLNIPIGNYKRNKGILEWLAGNDRNQALSHIFKFINEDDQIKFLDAEKKFNAMMSRQEAPGLPTHYLENNSVIEVDNEDPLWLEKGVVTKRISPVYVNLYKWNLIDGSWAPRDVDEEDPMLLSIEIIKYAFNLLTNFQNTQILLRCGSQSIPITLEGGVPKPNYDAAVSVFENGWNRVRSLKLFEHFLNEALPGLDFGDLDYLPEDVRLLMISLVYFSSKKPAETAVEVCSVLLSYVALSLLARYHIGNSKVDMSEKPILDSTTNTETITENDKIAAAAMLKEYFQSTTGAESIIIFAPQLVHPLVELQHCMDHINKLNILCGAPYKPTVYSKTFNGTFVYKILYTIKTYSDDCSEFLKTKMRAAPTVLAFLNGLIEVYEKILYGVHS